MAVAYGTAAQPGLLSQQYPPPLLPKPGKDNVRLQKLLKRTAKRKASAQASQSAAPFRSSLSPVNEASPDLEHSDHSTPPQVVTPETPPGLYSIRQPPRFTVRPLYQHVASPYPQRAAYGRAAGMSPQTVENPSYSYSQHVTTVSSYSASAHLPGVSRAGGQVTQPATPKISLPASSVSEATVPAAELKKSAVSTFAETHAGLRPAAATPLSIPTSSSPTPYPVAASQAMTRPLTVLTPLVKSKSPRPTFKATEPSRSPKPMFDVPQIRMYTATTSYYETSRTPPVYDTAGLTAIGSMVSQSKTDLTPASELRRGTAPTSHPSSIGTDLQRKTPSSDIERGAAPTAEVNTVVTPTSEIKRATPTAEIKTEIKKATLTAEIKTETKRATPTSEIQRATPTAEIKRGTPTSEIKRATPTSEVTVKTPTYEFQILRTSAGRPKTPAYHVTRATTPIFEISRPNPLLFAVSPITVQPERSRTPQTVPAASSSPASRSLKTTEPPETMLNGDIHTDMTSAAKPTQQNIMKSKSENDLTSGMILTAPVGSQSPKTPASVPITTAVTGYQRPKTPTYEASRLMTTSPSYKRPKTPTYGASPVGVSPVAFQRPKTPTQKSKSAYRGLTPAEYAAYGGIKTFSPAFGIISSVPATEEEVKVKEAVSGESKTPSQELSVKGQSSVDVFTVKETPKGVDKPHQRDEKIAATPSIPKIVVSEASDSSGTMSTKEISTAPGQVAKKQETALIKETPKAKSPTAEGKISEKQKVEKPVQETKAKTPEAKGPLPKSADQDPLKAVKKLLGKDKGQTPEQKIKPESSKTSTAAPIKVPAAESGTEDKVKDEKTDSASAVKPSPETNEASKTMLEAEPLLKVIQKPKGVKSKLSGWSRLKKHMVVEQEEPQFPETGSQKEVTVQDQSETKKLNQKAEDKAEDKPEVQDENQAKDAPVATKMWDAVLFQMFSSKENIMHQIELNKSEEEKMEETKEELKEIPSFAYRLPVLLFSPRFDAKRLKEAASRPVTKISTVFEMGLIGRKGKEEEPKDFNRTARGFTAT